MGIAKEGLDPEGSMQPVVLGELGSVVKADGFAHRLRKLSQLTSDGPRGEDGLSIDRLPRDAEAGVSFVEKEQPLAISGEQHEVGFPMPRHGAAFNLGGSFADRASVFDEAGRTAAWTSAAPSLEFVARQQAMPIILLGRTMIDETID